MKKRKIIGTSERPRLSVYKGLKHIYAQIIDDTVNKTLVGYSTKLIKTGTKTEKAAALGKSIAEKAKALGVSKIVFDRGKFQYHGRIKALADAARKGGLVF